MRATKDFWKQFNDDRISDTWKMPRKARDVATWGIFVAFILGMILTAVLVVYEVDKMNNDLDQISEAEYKLMIIKYSDCFSMELILANEPLDHIFRERLFSTWAVNCQ